MSRALQAAKEDDHALEAELGFPLFKEGEDRLGWLMNVVTVRVAPPDTAAGEMQGPMLISVFGQERCLSWHAHKTWNQPARRGLLLKYQWHPPVPASGSCLPLPSPSWKQACLAPLWSSYSGKLDKNMLEMLPSADLTG